MNKKHSNTITLVTIVDNHFVMLLAALLKSIEVNHKTSEQVVVYIVDDGINKKNKEKLLNSVSASLLTISWLKMAEIIPKGFKFPLDSSSFPLNVYTRFLIPFFIPQEVERVIYLDVDMIVCEDISKLWNIDMENKVVAGVVDRAEKVSNKWGGILNYEALGLLPDTKYFNSGLLVIDPVLWRKLDITSKILKCVEENKKYAFFPDQYGINVVLANQWLELDPRWNCYAMLEYKNPYIIHFTGRKPIFKNYEFNKEYKEIFFQYLKMTTWKDFQPINESNRFIKKLYNVMHKKLLSVFRT